MNAFISILYIMKKLLWLFILSCISIFTTNYTKGSSILLPPPVYIVNALSVSVPQSNQLCSYSLRRWWYWNIVWPTPNQYISWVVFQDWSTIAIWSSYGQWPKSRNVSFEPIMNRSNTLPLSNPRQKFTDNTFANESYSIQLTWYDAYNWVIVHTESYQSCPNWWPIWSCWQICSMATDTFSGGCVSNIVTNPAKNDFMPFVKNCVPDNNTWIIRWRYHFDYNNNKIYDTGDGGVDWVNVYLYQYIPNAPVPMNKLQLFQTKKTDYYGTYIFTWLNLNGNYQVRFGIMSGFDFTIIWDQSWTSFLWNNSYTINNILNFFKNTDLSVYVPLATNVIQNAGIIKSNTNIYGRYHFDYNANSKYDTWDSGVEWGNIFIYNCDNNSLVKQVRTDYYGNYAITWLAIWNYKISAGILNTFSKTYFSGMDTCKLFDTNKNYYNYDAGIKKINCSVPQFIPAYKKFDWASCTLVDCGDNWQIICNTNWFSCKNWLQNIWWYCKPYTNVNYCVNYYNDWYNTDALVGWLIHNYTINKIILSNWVIITLSGNDLIQLSWSVFWQPYIKWLTNATWLINKFMINKYWTSSFMSYGMMWWYMSQNWIYTTWSTTDIFIKSVEYSGSIFYGYPDHPTSYYTWSAIFITTCYNWITANNNTQNWWTYSPSTILYTDRIANTGTLIADTNKWITNGTQIINTQYWKVEKTITLTWAVIKLLDLNIYLDRTKTVQNEFPDMKAIKEKYTNAMPHVWADMTDAYILAIASSEIAK